MDVTVVPVTAIPADMEGCDIGPETMKLFADAVKASKTVVWNGMTLTSEVMNAMQCSNAYCNNAQVVVTNG